MMPTVEPAGTRSVTSVREYCCVPAYEKLTSCNSNAGAVKSNCALPPASIDERVSKRSLTRFIEACAFVKRETRLEMTIIALRICVM